MPRPRAGVSLWGVPRRHLLAHDRELQNPEGSLVFSREVQAALEFGEAGVGAQVVFCIAAAQYRPPATAIYSGQPYPNWFEQDS